MANSFNDISQVQAPFKPTFDPQNLTATGAGRAIDVSAVGSNIINAELMVGDGDTFTSLAVKMQAAPDDGTGSPDSGAWVDIPGLNGDDVTFTTVTTDPGTSGALVQVVPFKLPQALSYSSRPYIWVRAHATLVGTGILMCVTLVAARKYDQLGANVAAPGNSGNNVIN